ncbi:12348_t:CDS:2 [Acaulospora colombiana]|uniref:12348_t:CDS:1 n=1 Tax=Acaulospora colombiana TaxID=27376 RepID=A0ACA9LFZ7_9GLOM|nr:12348_t:CDS:2 [Acaulospora colombiana]
MSDLKDGNTQKHVPNWKKFLTLKSTSSTEAVGKNSRAGENDLKLKRGPIDDVSLIDSKIQEQNNFDIEEKGTGTSRRKKKLKPSKEKNNESTENTSENLELLVAQSEISIPNELPTAAKIADLAGQARESTSREAQAIVNKSELESADGDKGEEKSAETLESTTKFARALEILRILS